MNILTLGLLTLISFATSISIASENGNKIKDMLRDFYKNPAHFMDRLAPEVLNGQMISRGYINYSEIKKVQIEKNKVREKIIQRSHKSLVPVSKMTDKDQAKTLIENQTVATQMIDLNSRGLARASLPVLPWSDSYWPIYKGLLGVRYADPKFPDSKVWVENYNYVLARPASSIVARGNSEEINQLSPAEKYDYLVGDSQMSMTQFSWAQGQRYMDRLGFVQIWMGICHGWAGAAHMLKPVPQGSIALKAVNGMRITFYQSDVKALQSMLWANSSPATRFAGTGCKTSNPERDPNGRVTDPGCLDNNPATFFLTLTNQLGIHQRSFVMDATYDAEVWNFPIASYDISYFNPQSLHPTSDLKQALIPIERFTIDKFRSYRSAEAKYIIGVISDVTYVIEINPTIGISNKSPTKTLRFIYDLELDAEYNVIGGEWYMNSHPDFLWTYDKEAQAISRIESPINSDDWNIDGPIPASWTSLAIKSSTIGSPLYSVIKKIIEAAPVTPPTDSIPENP